MNEIPYPHARPWRDRHGRVRWRFRKGTRTVYLDGAPGEPGFLPSYDAALAGKAKPKATVTRISTGAAPRSMRAAWIAYITTSPEWKQAEECTRIRDGRIADAFLQQRVVETAPDTWGEIPVADMKRRHLKAIIADMSDRPHAARRRLIVIRKMIGAALDQEWIESDPAHRLKYRPPPTKGWRAWTWGEMKAFEERWPIGSTPRLCYGLALWLGPRRKDVAALATVNIDGDSITFTTHKTGRVVSGHITPMLREVLDATDLSGPTILKTAYGLPFSEKSLTGRMADWTHAAGLPKGCTIHGLRKTLGKLIADAGVSTRQAMAALGHDDLKQAELYSEESDRETQARDAMTKVTALIQRRKAAG
jgi:integrase